MKKGLVARKEHSHDRRVRQVELTTKGRALIIRGFREHAAAMENSMRVLSKKGAADLAAVVEKIGQARSKVTAVGLSLQGGKFGFSG